MPLIDHIGPGDERKPPERLLGVVDSIAERLGEDDPQFVVVVWNGDKSVEVIGTMEPETYRAIFLQIAAMQL